MIETNKKGITLFFLSLPKDLCVALGDSNSGRTIQGHIFLRHSNDVFKLLTIRFIVFLSNYNVALASLHRYCCHSDVSSAQQCGLSPLTRAYKAQDNSHSLSVSAVVVIYNTCYLLGVYPHNHHLQDLPVSPSSLAAT